MERFAAIERYAKMIRIRQGGGGKGVASYCAGLKSG